MRHVKEHGTDKTDRTGTGTRSVFAHQMRFNLQDGFPLVTTKKLHLKSIVHELIWFLAGSTNIAYLKEHGVSIWDDWADAEGNLGPIYGYQWRSWPTPDGGHVDQISQVMDQITNNPDSRRMIVSAWNVADVPKMKLPPCHALFQFYVADGKLSCQLYQRSADIFLGVPFNIASYALLTHMMAQQAYSWKWVILSGPAATATCTPITWNRSTCSSRAPMALPKLVIKRKPDSLFDFKFDDFEFTGYEPHGLIRAPVAV
ncbi:thymidylate synthase [Massilia sp. B-10]|nr:thymidylate synthase [Massilia sp. B-10]